MDRNTLLAFFLIALVLIFTPKYMETVSPPSVGDFPPDSISDGDKPLAHKTVTPSNSDKKLSKTDLHLSPSYNTENEKLTTIDSPLYTAVISSRGGGTIKSFHIKDYYMADSQMVNLVMGLDGLNLLTKVNNIDGQPINLSLPWQQVGWFSGGGLEEPETLTYSFEFSPGKHIRRVLTFDPGSYICLLYTSDAADE